MPYETERLILRPWQEEDAAELFLHAADPLVGPPAGWPPHTDVANSREIIRDILSAKGTFAVVLKATGLPIGSIGIMRNANIHTNAREAEIGYWIGRPYWGQGLIPEAVRECLRICFEEQDCARIWCACYEGNEKSRRVQEKCGFLYHHTEENKPVPLLGETRTEHISVLEKDRWQLLQRLQIIPAYDHGQTVCDLIREYLEALVKEQPNFRNYLLQQNYEQELLHPEEKYGMPDGRLYLLLVDDQPAGCIGLRKLDEESCEMKRMYVRPRFRKQGLADLLLRQFLSDARKIGYRRVLLDTFPFLQSAIRLYRRHGFYEIPSYNGSPMEELIYMQMDL